MGCEAGSRLADELAFYLRKLHEISEVRPIHLHLAGHSLGGVLIRFALARLAKIHEMDWQLHKLKYNIQRESVFIYASPWLGIMNKGIKFLSNVLERCKTSTEMNPKDRLSK